nr:uncharacterized protein LOC128698324 [Cherax quadricarinatus]
MTPFSPQDIEDLIGTALIYQYMFTKSTSPWERSHWTDRELEGFEIDLEAVDRLYYVHHADDGVSGREFEFAGRMEYHNHPVYVKMSAGCDFTGFDCQGGGSIYISRDAQIFLEAILEDEYQPRSILQAMLQDGLQVHEPAAVGRTKDEACLLYVNLQDYS